jgi:hypothetical protein
MQLRYEKWWDWFGLDDFLKINRTKPNRMHFYLAVRVIFMLKTEPTALRAPLPLALKTY